MIFPTVLIVIPARGGSKGIPRKNTRLLGYKPLLSYAIENSLSLVEYASKHMNIKVDITVSSEDEFIEEYVTKVYPQIIFIKRSKELSRDAVTLDPVVLHATKEVEKIKNTRYDIVITRLPTMPLLSKETFIKAFTSYIEYAKNNKSLVLVKEHRHLFWRYDNKLNKYNMLTERKNRQYLVPLYEETGGIVITDRDFLFSTGSRVSSNPYLMVSPPEEAIDINTWEDFVLAERLLCRRRIGFIVSGSFHKGMGHVYRTLTIALRLIEHDIVFFINEEDKEAIDLVKNYFFKVIIYKTNEDLSKKIVSMKISAVINDTRGMNSNLSNILKEKGIKIISINEMDPISAKNCDLIINPEFEFYGYSLGSPATYLAGYQYNIVRDDVLMFPIKKMPEKIEKILITMGGSDPENTTYKILTYLQNISSMKSKEIYVVIGGFFKEEYANMIHNLIKKMSAKGFKIHTIHDTNFMGYYIYNSDLIISSNSSTVYDAVALGTFTVVISKVKDEIAHLFSYLSGATLYLGYHGDLSFERFKRVINNFISNKDMRRDFYIMLTTYAKNIRYGQKKVYNAIKKVIEGGICDADY